MKRWFCTKVEPVAGSNPWLVGDTGKIPGLIDSDIKYPWSARDLDSYYSIVNAIPQAYTFKNTKVDFDAEYVHANSECFKRLLGDPTYASSTNTYKFPSAHDYDPETWSWNYRAGARAYDVLGCVTRKITLDAVENNILKVTESVLGREVVAGTVLAGDPAMSGSVLTFDDIVEVLAGTDDVVSRVTGFHLDIIHPTFVETGGGNPVPFNIGRGNEGKVMFAVSAIFKGEADDLDEKLVNDLEEAFYIEFSDGTYLLSFKAYAFRYLAKTMTALKNDKILYTVSCEAIKSGANFIEIAAKDGVDWS